MGIEQCHIAIMIKIHYKKILLQTLFVLKIGPFYLVMNFFLPLDLTNFEFIIPCPHVH
jgi:hypothetical protein